MDGPSAEDYHYKTFESDSIFMLVKPLRIETEQAMMAAIQFDMLIGEKFVRFFCYTVPSEIFDVFELLDGSH